MSIMNVTLRLAAIIGGCSCPCVVGIELSAGTGCAHALTALEARVSLDHACRGANDH